MAKLFGIDFVKWDKEHARRTESYVSKIQKIYDAAAIDAARIGASINNVNPDKPFSLNDYPTARKKIDKLISGLNSSVTDVIRESTREEWLYSCKKNDDVVDKIFNNPKAKSIQLDKYYNHNLDALDAFQKRKDENGLNLSDRVWKNGERFRSEIELGLDAGLGEGRSAAELARDLKENLNEPNRLFRRVRDKRGNLQLSKHAAAFHPGQGVYRSSVKNAQRLTRSETNMAYRTADYERWQQMDFILGFEVKLSKAHKIYDICDILAGKYPKGFKFVGWHPHCYCFVVPILPETDDFINSLDDENYSFKGKINDVPEGFTNWVKDNQDRINRAKALPYFIRDNKNFVQPAKEIESFVKAENNSKRNAILSNAKTRQGSRSNEEIQKIQNNWLYRKNLDEVAQKVGVKRGVEMSFKEANELHGNINYSLGIEYKINCQSCVVSNELRRRGLNVTAHPNLKIRGSAPYEVSRDTALAWIDPITKIKPVKKTAGGYDYTTWKVKSRSVMYKELRELTNEPGRYHIDFGWSGCSRSGHIITLERLENGLLRIYDPQNGKLVTDWAEYLKRISPSHGIHVLRVDTLHINTKIVDGLVKKL